MDTQNQPTSIALTTDSPADLAQGKTVQPEAHPAPVKRVPRQRTQEPNPSARRPRKVRVQRKRRLSTEQIKAQLQARLGDLSNATLKGVLIACGITAGIAVGIIAFTKFVPVGVAILAILGLGVVVRFMEEIRRLPFCPSPRS
jgi:hypothetical protein